MSHKKIAVLGSGANGASIGADLTRAGLDVVLIDQWPEHVEAMRRNGIRIEKVARSECGACGEVTARPAQATRIVATVQPTAKIGIGA